MSKKSIIWLIIIIIIASILVWYGVSRKPKEEEIIKIGVAVDLSGLGANYGTLTKNGVTMAVEEINEEGGINGRKIELIIDDHQNNPAKGASICKKFAEVDRVPAIIAITSGIILSCAPILENAHVVLMNSAALNPQIREAGDYVFSNIPDAEVEVKAMAEFAYHRLGIHELAIFHSTSGSGVGAKDALVRQFPALGGKIIGIESHNEGDADFRTQLTKLKNLNPPAIYLASTTRESALILKQAQEMQIKTQWLSYAPFQGEDILLIAGEAAEGVIYTFHSFDPQYADETMKNFIVKYKVKYGVEPEMYSATGYDAMKILSFAMRQGGIVPEEIKQTLYTIQDFPGVSGKTSFDKDGCVTKTAVFKTIKNGQFVPLENY